MVYMYLKFWREEMFKIVCVGGWNCIVVASASILRRPSPSLVASERIRSQGPIPLWSSAGDGTAPHQERRGCS